MAELGRYWWKIATNTSILQIGSGGFSTGSSRLWCYGITSATFRLMALCFKYYIWNWFIYKEGENSHGHKARNNSSLEARPMVLCLWSFSNHWRDLGGSNLSSLLNVFFCGGGKSWTNLLAPNQPQVFGAIPRQWMAPEPNTRSLFPFPSATVLQQQKGVAIGCRGIPQSVLGAVIETPFCYRVSLCQSLSIYHGRLGELWEECPIRFFCQGLSKVPAHSRRRE